MLVPHCASFARWYTSIKYNVKAMKHVRFCSLPCWIVLSSIPGYCQQRFQNRVCYLVAQLNFHQHLVSLKITFFYAFMFSTACSPYKQVYTHNLYNTRTMKTSHVTIYKIAERWNLVLSWVVLWIWWYGGTIWNPCFRFLVWVSWQDCDPDQFHTIDPEESLFNRNYTVCN